MSADPECACFGGAPASPDPQPGLTRIPWRLATHGTFNGAMLDQLHKAPALARLTTRDPSDPAIALLDGWAVTLDILAFYNERIGNEGFLRPATERRSVLELARLIGYSPAPGVSASTFLAVNCDTIPGSPEQVTLPAGAGVMSVPGPGEKPQIFETDAEIVARPAWQDLHAQSVHYVAPAAGDTRLMLYPPTQLKTGDMVLVVGGERIADAQSPRWQARRVAGVEDIPADPIDQVPPRSEVLLESALGAAATIPLQSPRVYAMRQRTNIFGHNAPAWESLPIVLRVGEFLPIAVAAQTVPALQALEASKQSSNAIVSFAPGGPSGAMSEMAAGGGTASLGYGGILDDITNIMEFDATRKLAPGIYAGRRTSWADAPFPAGRDYIDLDQVYDRFVAGSWIVLRAGTTMQAYQVTEATEISVSDFGMSAKVTRLKLRGPSLSSFSPRSTSVHGVSELIPWGMTPITTPVAGREVTLSKPVEGLAAGQRVALTGSEAASGNAAARILTIEQVSTVPAGGDAAQLAPPATMTTRLRFTSDIAPGLAPRSVRINANVVSASHGETREDAIGNGNAAIAFQTVPLPSKPLTWVSSSNPPGRATTLRVRIGASWWNEVHSFVGAGPRDRVFTTRTADDGTVTVQFGDGVTGARLPSGKGNIMARYRTGTGLAGMLKAGQLSQPLQRPAGFAGVVNPLPTGGAEDPESLDAARANAPVTVRAMERIVSLADVADYARAFAGIGKADAALVRDGTWRSIVLTIADTGGGMPAAGDTLFDNLEESIAAVRSGGDYAGQRHGLPITLAGYRARGFALRSELILASDAVAATVLAAARAALLQAFGFAARQFAQPASLAEASAVLHGVGGVRAARFTRFHRLDQPAGVAPVLPSAMAGRLGNGWQGAELLTLDPDQLVLTQVQ
ncbi:putative baseplate assembly protein [Novosphingobium sp. CF614]|uniref:hypothetical protein n=1 Tax=Novosphingobium sp. CF614 TaxID=1884364 RepID=UPI0008EA0666|nr:hypothetical protein [Novosphingobium sp. CF614]SFF76490.1 putative baseplate assembly protein [Novosphingobium sp. CF614]